MIHFLNSLFVYYDQVHLYANNIDHNKYQTLIDVRYDVLVCSNENIIPMGKMNNRPGENSDI